MQTLTSLSKEPLIERGRCATHGELQERPDASLVWTSPAEPLNATPSRLSSVGIGEGKSNLGHRDAIVSRVPVVSADGTPLMPCKPAKARKLLRDGKALKRWSRLGIFYIQLAFNPGNPTKQPIAAGADPGSKFEGISVVGTKDTVLNIMSEAVDWVKGSLEQRRRMRRARRYRKTRCRECRFDNRLKRSRLPPSTKARWDAKLRVISQLKRIIPVSHVVVEDVKAATREGQRRWNSNFSPIEAGKQYFCSALKAMGLEVITRSGKGTKAFRDSLGLKKIKSKSRPVFESHCVDAWCLAASITGADRPSTRTLYYAVPLRFHRRQLHRLEPSKGGVRRRYGGTVSLGLKKGTLVKHVKYGLCYIGGNLKNMFSLHSLKTGRRITQNAKRSDFKILTRMAFRTQFLPPLKGAGFLG